eukprot:SAG11_NODE_167_length_13647_cov_7.705049_12_plen_47_part_00
MFFTIGFVIISVFFVSPARNVLVYAIKRFNIISLSDVQLILSVIVS